MRIGLTYDLRVEYLAAGYGEEETAEFDRPETVDAIVAALDALGHEPDRIGNVRQLVGRLASGDSWDLVFNIAEGLHGVGREAQAPAILDAYGIPYTFSDPLVMTVCLHKATCKRILQSAGIPTPAFSVVERTEDLDGAQFPFPVFAKPVAEGTGKGIGPASRIEDRAALECACRKLLERYRQPVLVEAFLPGREFTVGILGSGRDASMLGTMEIVLQPGAEPAAYSYVNKERCEDLVEYVPVRAGSERVVGEAEAIALNAWRLLGCRDAGRLDLRCDASGKPQLMEINPLAGLHPEHSDLPILCAQRGLSYEGLIERILRSAQARVASVQPPRQAPVGVEI